MNRQERRRLAREARKTKSGPVDSGERDPLVVAQLQQAIELLESGKAPDALALCTQALATAPNDPEVLNVAGIAAFRHGDETTAIRHLKKAVQLAPAHADARLNLGNVQRSAGQIAEAEAAYRHALTLAPDNLDARFNLGLLQESGGNFIDAIETYKACLAQKPKFPEASFNLANVFKALTRLPEAEAAYRDAIEAKPDFSAAWSNLGALLHERGDAAGALDAYERAIGLDAGFAEAHYNRGIALQDLARPDDAIAAYRRAIGLEPGHVGALLNLAATLRVAGQLEDAEAAYRDAIAAAPDYPKATVELAGLLMQTGRLAAAEALTAEFLSRNPGDLTTLGFRTVLLPAMASIGKVWAEEARKLSDFGRFLLPVECPPPPGHADIGAFNKALAAHVLAHPSLVQSPLSHATRNGQHSGELLVEPKGPMAGLEDLIRQAVEAWMGAVEPDAAHPFLAIEPSRLALTAWAVVMEKQGHQVPHIHPAAWLSGVYYVKLPSVVRMEGRGQEGWIEFGRPPESYEVGYEPDVELIQPAEGMMIVFPSYLYHRTIPYESDETRISIAFDVFTEL